MTPHAQTIAPANPLHATDFAAVLLRLQAEMVSHTSFAAAAAALAAGLAAEGGFERVSLGLRHRAASRVVAVSDGVPVTEDSADMRQLATAMDEALDQGATVSVPAVTADKSIASLAHRVLVGRGGACCTVPLVAGGKTVGAITFERAGGAFSGAEIETLEHAVCLLGPVVYLLWRDAMPWHARLGESWKQAFQRLRGPKKRALRLGAAGAAAVLFALLFLPVDRHISGRARIEGVAQRVLVAPTEGFIHSTFVRPGDRVAAGQVLFELSDKDLQLEKRKWASQLVQYQNSSASAIARADRGLAAVQLARVAEAQAQLELVDSKLARSRVAAPFDGMVIQGDLAQSIGAPVQQGDALMTVARTDSFRVVVEIDERDIQPLRAGQHGSIALSALPWDALRIELTRITPVSTLVEGSNVFEVEAELLEQSADVRPGLRGVAKVTAGTQPLLVGWTRRVVDWGRLWLWSWAS